MTEDATTKDVATGDATTPAAPAVPVPSRRIPFGLLRVAAAAVLMAVLGTTTVFALEKIGFSAYADPFVLYNRNRIEAAEARARRAPDGMLVVALGTSRLRDATLDEAAMAELAAADGVAPFAFLRITADSADFRDFEPLLERILAARPDRVLIDMDLMFRERRPLAFAAERLRRTAQSLVGGHPFSLDQVRQQYARACDGPASAPATAIPVAARSGGIDPASNDVAAFIDRQDWRFSLSAKAGAYERVRAFAARAGAAGIPVTVLQLRRPPAVEERRFGGAPFPPDAMARLAADDAFGLWSFPGRLQHAASYCDLMHLGGEARAAYSAWLVATLTGGGGDAPIIEAVSLQ